MAAEREEATLPTYPLTHPPPCSTKHMGETRTTTRRKGKTESNVTYGGSTTIRVSSRFPKTQSELLDQQPATILSTSSSINPQPTRHPPPSTHHALHLPFTLPTASSLLLHHHAPSPHHFNHGLPSPENRQNPADPQHQQPRPKPPTQLLPPLRSRIPRRHIRVRSLTAITTWIDG